MQHIWFEGIPWDGHFEQEYDTDGRPACDFWVEDKDWKRFLRPSTWVSDFGAGHGGDEYGNCTLYLRTCLGSVIWRYPTGRRQTDVEIHTDYPLSAMEWMVRVFDGRDAWIEWRKKHGSY